MVKLISVGDCIVPGNYIVHSKFSRVINFSRENFQDEWLLSVVKEEIGGGPYNIVIDSIDDFNQVSISEDFISLGSSKINSRDSFVYSSKIPDLTIKEIDQNIELFEKELLKYGELSPLIPIVFDQLVAKSGSSFDRAVTRRLQQGVEKLYVGKIIESVNLMKGVGSGLTPSGDDFISGLLIGARILSKSRQTGENIDTILDDIFSIVKSENRVSNSILFAHRFGRVTALMKEFLESLSSNTESTPKRIRDSIKKLSLVGHSSGLDSLVGLFVSLKRKEIWL